MVEMSLCANQPTSELIDVMIGNFTLALPCILDGNRDCLMYDILIEGASNFLKMARLSPVAAANYNEMAKWCEAAYEDVKNAKTPMEVSSRTCLLLEQLIATMKKHGVCDCPLVPNALKATNLLTIVKPENMKQILSTENNLKYLFDIKDLIK